jgi:hypothetical protein
MIQGGCCSTSHYIHIQDKKQEKGGKEQNGTFQSYIPFSGAQKLLVYISLATSSRKGGWGTQHFTWKHCFSH